MRARPTSVAVLGNAAELLPQLAAAVQNGGPRPHAVTDKLVGDDEARTIAGRVLARKKNSIPAQRVLFGDREILEKLEKEKNKVNK